MHATPQKTSKGDVLRTLAVSIMWIGLWISVFVIGKTNDSDSSHSIELIRALVLSCSRALQGL